MHWKRWKNHGDPTRIETAWSTGRRQRAKPGTRYHDRHGGYVKILTGDGRLVKEHRYVLEQALGRALLPDETVHHRNGIRRDNRLENLELRINSHGQGITVEEALAWAAEIQRRYGVGT